MTETLNKGQQALRKAQQDAGGRVGGRKKGTPNKLTSVLKELIPEAAAAIGADGTGKDGLLGWLMTTARENPVAYLRLLEKLIPHQVDLPSAPAHKVTYTSYEEAADDFARRGLPIPPDLARRGTYPMDDCEDLT